MASPEIEVIRSARRTRTAQARLVGEKIEVRIPARMTKAEETKVVAELVAKVRQKSVSSHRSDDALQLRAEQLNREVLGGQARIGSIRFVGNQRQRWGSCSTATADIRISDRLREVPDYVLDAVIVHELTHTFVSGGHTAEFWEWANRTPKAERANGYLEAYQRFS
ncbi:SprT-like domain-containing protein [Corynebacterium sp. A21]|uniref:SprT-like domain-containing protein n=1 Tax=Corynebacterium sp. A21 TaxID=3457318 RepID=UPI003FD501EA